MTSAAPTFGERLAAQVAARESQIVLGIDPDPAALWPGSQPRLGGRGLAGSATGRAEDAGLGQAGPRGSAAERAAEAVLSHCIALIDAAGPACAAVKPQLACFERLGWPGVRALAATVRHAKEAGLFVIADGKRGDIDVSARAYAQSLFGGLQTPYGEVEGLEVEMATVNPLMGRDTLLAMLEVSRETGSGLLVLVRTSNPGAADVEDLPLEGAPFGAARVWERLAGLVAELGEQAIDRSGLGDVGAVVGATEPAHLARARELMKGAVFLLPGVGAQGGRVEELAPAFENGRHGGLISASRSIAGAHLKHGGDPAAAARAEAERLRALAWEISG